MSFRVRAMSAVRGGSVWGCQGDGIRQQVEGRRAMAGEPPLPALPPYAVVVFVPNPPVAFTPVRGEERL